jgi:hypothetical protein
MPPAYIDPCNGHFPHKLAAGCCPIERVRTNRVVTGHARSAIIADVLPDTLQGTITSTDMAFLNVTDHTPDASFDFEAASVEALMEAVKGGVISAGDAMSTMAIKIPTATPAEQDTLKNCISAIKDMVSIGHVAKGPGETNGNFLRIWAISVNKAKAVGQPIVVIDGSTFGEEFLKDGHKYKSRVERLTSEQYFDAALYQFVLFVHVTGVMAVEISSVFVHEVAYLTRIKHGKSFWVAQEYFIACLDLLDNKTCKASEIKNHDRNVMLANAERFAQKFIEAYSEKTGGVAVPLVDESGSAGKPPFNGQCQPATSKANCCPYFNRNKAHDNPKHLDSRGKCIFRHVCNHWVDNKGPSGRCLSEGHGWHDCTNPNKCDKALD